MGTASKIPALKKTENNTLIRGIQQVLIVRKAGRQIKEGTITKYYPWN